jgi:sarcosine oxidase
MRKSDVIVLGLGAMGSAALYQLAKRGVRVLGIDQFSPPHDLGSSHGDTRITRLAIGEGAHYTPLVMRSHEIWREIERETGTDLLAQCGELIISSDNKAAFTHVEGFFQNTVDAAKKFGIAHELLDATAIRARFPAFNIRDDEFGYFEPEAGFVRPERCIAAQLALAEKHGAAIQRNEKVLGFESASGRVTVRTDRGRYEADALIVAAGAWIPQLVGSEISGLLRIYRQVLTWFAVDGERREFAPGAFPVFIWELPDTRQGVYGFPDVDGAGMKIATEQYASTTAPDGGDRSVAMDDIVAMHRDYVAPYFRGVSARCTKTATCFYTVTPDAGFIVDRLPASDRVIIASCCSGHGFKHSAAMGEVLADMAQGTESRFNLTPFRLSRFG